MWIKDLISNGLKIFRDHSIKVNGSPLDPKYKPNQGAKVVQDTTTGEYHIYNQGEEEGWFYNEKYSSSSRVNGCWTTATPAVYNTISKTFTLIKDKALTKDTDFEIKTEQNTAGDTHSKARIVASTDEEIYGLLVCCPNHASQELLFLPVQTAGAKTYAKIAFNLTLTYGDLSEGELVIVNNDGTITSTGTKVWINAELLSSPLISIGNTTIFEIQLLNQTCIRNSEDRPLYRIISTIKEDIAYKPKYVRGISILSNKIAVIRFHTNFVGNESDTIVYTTIAGTDKENILIGKIADDWEGITNSFYWAMLVSTSPLIIGPIEPVCIDYTNNKYMDINLTDGTAWNCEGDPSENSSISIYYSDGI